MKTKIFNIWTNKIELFLKQIANDQVSYEDLSNWMDKSGAQFFYLKQKDYFDAHKAEFLKGAKQNPPDVKFKLAYDQVEFGFDGVFCELMRQFPELGRIADKYDSLKEACLSRKYYTTIAARAIITTNMELKHEEDKAKGNPPATYQDISAKIKDMDDVIDEFNFLKEACEASLESMLEFRKGLMAVVAKRAVDTVPRNPGSPALHKTPGEKPAVDCKIVHEKASPSKP